ncbi:MAG: 6-phosphogluconolactonase [Odoribacter sp.]|nr:6-phosphogluconolactonase [Odoribacter sp.]
MELELYDTAEHALRGMTDRLVHELNLSGKPFHLALSGAGTARRMYDLWVREYREKINWEQLYFYWVDERCVDPQDEESNFRYANELLFCFSGIPLSHIHRIHGECFPETEAERYAELVKRSVPVYAGLPSFDGVILGIGEDGHTASLFPDAMNLLTDERCYVVSQHPLSGQKRITMTGPLILNSKMILIPVIGRKKNKILQQILNSIQDEKYHLPAAYIIAHAPQAVVFTDSQVRMK